MNRSAVLNVIFCLSIALALSDIPAAESNEKHGVEISVRTKSEEGHLSDEPWILNSAKFPEDFRDFVTVVAAHANLDISLRFRPEFDLSVDFDRADFVIKMLRPLQINFPSFKNYLGQFVPTNLIIGESDSDLLVRGRKANGEARVTLDFFKNNQPIDLPLKVSTQRLGQFMLYIKGFEMAAYEEGAGDYKKAFPFVCEMENKDSAQKRSCFGVVWKSLQTEKWMFRFVVFNFGATPNPEYVLQSLLEHNLDIFKFYNNDCMIRSDCSLQAVQKSAKGNSRAGGHQLLGMDDQAMFLVEGPFDGSERTKILTQLLVNPQEKDFRIPGILPGFVAVIKDDTFIHFMYQDFFKDDSIPVVLLDFVHPDKNGIMERTPVRMDWRPFLSMNDKMEDRRNQAGHSQNAISWLFGNLTETAFDIPFSISSRIFLRGRGDRIVIMRHHADIWARDKWKKKFEF